MFSTSNQPADEWKKFGLYFAYHVFHGIQKTEYLEHFHILVRAILMLLGPQVIKRDIQVASNLLKEFVAQYEVNNQKKAVTKRRTASSGKVGYMQHLRKIKNNEKCSK